MAVVVGSDTAYYYSHYADYWLQALLAAQAILVQKHHHIPVSQQQCTHFLWFLDSLPYNCIAPRICNWW